MRTLGAILLLGCAAACSLVVRSKTKDYEGSCAAEEEAAKARYDASGRPASDMPAARSLPQIASDCRGCASEDCVEACIGESTGQAISRECASCFADAADCGFTHCRAACSTNLIEAACLACLCNNGCTEELEACAGLELAQCGQDR